ncbi:MAG: hypothetical protein BWX64_01631 [Acidobacteria bacterium ADurb.Bin051]|nr:MAG: hypothetical protein BWX64_01631 [Acidobacteria bacterium ADurb.Bin051]
MALGDLLAGLLDEAVEEVVGLHADPLASGHLDAAPLLLADRLPELPGGRRRERDHLVGEVDRVGRRLGVAERFEAGADDPLQVALAGVDHVDHPPRVAEGGRVLRTLRGRLPDSLLHPVPVGELLAEQPELPELVGDVLAHVGDRAVGADDHLVGIFEPGELGDVGERHDPAAGVLAVCFQAHGAALPELLEGVIEEVEAEDVALAGEQVVADAEPRHRAEVAPHDPAGDQPGGLGPLARAGFERVEGLAAPFEPGRILLVPAPDPGVEIPAVVVERLGERPDLGERRRLEVEETDHDVGELDAGVVDVVLDLDRVAERPQRAPQQVAEHRVAQMPDVRRLVRVDVRVLDDDLRGPCRRGRSDRRGGEQPGGEGAAGEREVQVAGPLHPQRPNAGRQLPAAGELLGDLTGRPAELPGEVERGGEGEVAEGAPGWYLGDRTVFDPVPVPDPSGQLGRQGLLPGEEHAAESTA